MGAVTYLGFVGLSVLLGFGATRFDPAVIDRLAREVGFDRTNGWTVFVVATLWAFLPFLGGAAATGDGADPWLAGSAVAFLGFYLLAVAAGSLDEYRLLRDATVLDAAGTAAAPDEDVVAVSGVPEVAAADETDAEAPFSRAYSVHADWIVQRRRRIGIRKVWDNVATGVRSVPFTLADGRVRVESGRQRVFSGAETIRTVDPDEPLPESAAAFLRDREELPDPSTRDEPLRFLEQVVPADEPVTVVGSVRRGQEPGQVVLDEAPADDLLGTHADYATGDGTDPEAVLVRGTVDEARSHLRKRVYWVGGAGVAAVLGGQVVAFWLSAATLGGLV